MRVDRSGIMKFTILAGIAALLAGAVIHPTERQAAAPAASGGAAPAYEVYAIRYATSPGYEVSRLVAGADPARTVDMPFMFWVLKGTGNRNVLIDAGTYRGPFVEHWELQNVIKPSIAIGKVGLTPDQITDVILTQMHWDHVEGVDLFPKARVWMQREEYDHYIDARGHRQKGLIAPEDATMLANLRQVGRLMMVDGDAQEIVPGIVVYTGCKHTYASQYVGVRTGTGTVVVASDCVYTYENLEKHLPLGLTQDRDADFHAWERMLRIASNPRLIVPGHDPAVFERFPKPGGGVAKIE